MRKMIALAVLAAALCGGRALALSPLLTNNSFQTGVLTPWTDANACTGVSNATDQDGDNFYANATQTGLNGSAVVCTANLKQAFTISGTPSAQSGSVYLWMQVTGAGSFCNTGASSIVNVAIKTNGSTVYSNASPSSSPAWQPITFTPTLIAGTNTLEIDATMTGAAGYSNSLCSIQSNGSAIFRVDTAVLTATVSGQQQWLGSWR